MRCVTVCSVKRDEDTSGVSRGFLFVFLQRVVRNEAEEVEFLHGPLNDQPSSSPSILSSV